MKPKAVVISFPSLTAINRKVYGLLAEQYDVRLIIPVSASFGNMIKPAEPAAEGDPPLILLPLIRDNPRLQYFRGLWKSLKTERPEFIFLENDPISVLCVVCCFYKLYHGTKLICQTNENLPLSLKQLFSSAGLRTKILLLVKRITCFFTRPGVDEVFTINYEGKKIFEDLKFKKVSRIPLGYDPKYFHPDLQAREEIKEKLGLGPMTIGYFGRIVPQKGLLLLLKALTGLARYPWKLLIDDFSAYTTDYIQEIKLFIKQNGLEDRVVFFHAGHEEIPGYMCACDLVVVPSITEGSFKEQYGRVVQEAIACGCLTITSGSGFLPNFFRDDTFIFKENDIQAIQEKIEFFINLPEAEKNERRKDSMYYIDQFFSIRAQVDVIINSFRQIP